MTMSAVRLLSASSGGQTAEWKPDGRYINVVAANDQQAICSSGKQLYYFELGNGQITLARFVSCIVLPWYLPPIDEKMYPCVLEIPSLKEQNV